MLNYNANYISYGHCLGAPSQCGEAAHSADGGAQEKTVRFAVPGMAQDRMGKRHRTKGTNGSNVTGCELGQGGGGCCLI